MKKINEILTIALGRNTGNDWDSFKVALADGIIGSLKDIDFFKKANRLVIGCKKDTYQYALESSKDEIIKKFKNQGLKKMAQAIEGENGFSVKIQSTPKGVDAKIIPIDALPVKFWYYLEYENQEPPELCLSGPGISSEGWVFEPSEGRYTIGRGQSSNNPTMKTIPNAPKGISRRQAELLFKDGQWKCKSISLSCPTYVNSRLAKGDEPVTLENSSKGGTISFGVGENSYTLHYHMNNTK